MILYAISHENEDELFMVFKGTLLVDFRHGKTVEVKEGEILIIPRGVGHKPHTNGEVVFNLFGFKQPYILEMLKLK